MKKYIFSLLIITLLASCNDYQLLEKNPNLANNAPASLILQGVLNEMNNGAWNDVMRYNQFYCSNYNYYANNEYSWTTTGFNYTTLKNVIKMEEEATRSGAKVQNPYAALGKFFRAYFFVNMTLRVGDVPMKEALQGLTNDKPKYDSQKDVYVQSLKWLDDANTDLAALIAAGDNSLSGDFYQNNDLKKWQKSINAFRLRVLVSLSKKESDTDLGVKTKFAEMVGNSTKYPLLSNISESLQYSWNAFNKYPRNPDNFGFNATRENMAKTYTDAVVGLKDPRIFVVAEPAEAKLKAGLKATDFEAYVGASSGEDLADMSTKALNGQYSFQSRKRYYSNYTGENTFIIGYPEMCFSIAEGINRGWATGNAEDWYQKGIKASMEFYGIADTQSYLAQTTVKYAGNNADGLKQVLTQKYIAFFQNSGFEAFYNQRRTGVPTFLVGPGTGNSTKIPRRWQYPASEKSTNGDNLKSALTSQFPNGADDINMDLWILK